MMTPHIEPNTISPAVLPFFSYLLNATNNANINDNEKPTMFLVVNQIAVAHAKAIVDAPLGINNISCF